MGTGAHGGFNRLSLDHQVHQACRNPRSGHQGGDGLQFLDDDSKGRVLPPVTGDSVIKTNKVCFYFDLFVFKEPIRMEMFVKTGYNNFFLKKRKKRRKKRENIFSRFHILSHVGPSAP